MKRTPAVISTLTVVLAVSLTVASTPAMASEAFLPPSASTRFVNAQQAMGLDAHDAPYLAPGITVENSGDASRVTLGDVSIGLTHEGTSASTTVLENGVRMMALLTKGETSTQFSIDLPPNAAIKPTGNEFDIVLDAGGTKLLVGHIAAPWAVDATGKELPTTFQLHGHTLTQSVQTGGAVFPVVADPTITAGLIGASDGPGAYWNMTGTQRKALSAATTTVLGLATVGGCVAASKIPKVGFIISGLCGFVGVPQLKTIWRSVSGILSDSSIVNSACYQIKVAPVGKKFFKVAASNCA